MPDRHDDTHPESPEDRGAGEAAPSDQTRASERYTSSTKDKTRYELEAAKEYAEMIVGTIREALLILDLDLRVRSASRSFYAMFETTPEETEGRLFRGIEHRDEILMEFEE